MKASASTVRMIKSEPYDGPSRQILGRLGPSIFHSNLIQFARIRRLLRFASFTGENPIWSNSEGQNRSLYEDGDAYRAPSGWRAVRENA